jgi:hypothetical protein
MPPDKTFSVFRARNEKSYRDEITMTIVRSLIRIRREKRSQVAFYVSLIASGTHINYS